MSSQVYKALFKDALYQVLDNRVFRLLAVMTTIFVAPTFLIAAKDENLDLFFGWKEYHYVDIFAFFNLPYPGIEDANEMFIGFIQTLFVDYIVGSFGIMFSIAATAFFVPRMLEKGAADTLFSKPISRLTLLLSRYVSGLLFVVLLSSILVGGMHIGLTVRSGYSSVGFLWSILTLSYLFSIYFVVSIAVSVFTRSTVASILVTLIFMAFNGCVHGAWTGYHATEEIQNLAEHTNSDVDGGDDMEAFERWVVKTMNTLHIVLPKTADAARISMLLRAEFEDLEPEFEDPVSGIRAGSIPEGMERTGDSLEGDGVRWNGDTPEGPVRIRMIQAEWPEMSDEFLGDRGIRDHYYTEYATELRITELANLDSVTSDVEESRGSSRRWIRDEGYGEIDRIGGYLNTQLHWQQSHGANIREHTEVRFSHRDALVIITLESPEAWLEDEVHEREWADFLAAIQFSDGFGGRMDPDTWYSSQFGWTSPWRFNAWFSIGSSLAFGLVIFGLAYWKLRRADF